MVLVPAGSFIMGDGESYGGEDEHEVTLTRDFYLGRHEVTNAEYVAAVQWAYDNGHVTATTSTVQDNLDGTTVELLDLDSQQCEIQFDRVGTFSLRDAGYGINPDHPVKEVTWYGASRFCDWLSLQAGLPRAYAHYGYCACNGTNPYAAQGYRLPTDAEWEYAAQYDDERIYPWGNEASDCGRSNHRYCVGWTFDVGGHPSGNSALGLSDMAGNVWEWCNDWHVHDLGTASVIDPVGPTVGDGSRGIRGGSWNVYDTYDVCAARLGQPPDESYSTHGLRVARTAEP